MVESKNRHLVETAFILLLDNISYRFLEDAILIACYLINHMLSSVLHDKILTHGQDKLSTKVMKCVFLDYFQLQRDY